MSGGAIDEQALEKEMITRQELEMAAHAHGIPDLADVESAELDPDGELFFVAKASHQERQRHREILTRLDHLTRELESLRAELRQE